MGRQESDAVVGNEAQGAAATFASCLISGLPKARRYRVRYIMSVRETAPQMMIEAVGRPLPAAFVQMVAAEWLAITAALSCITLWSRQIRARCRWAPWLPQIREG